MFANSITTGERKSIRPKAASIFGFFFLLLCSINLAGGSSQKMAAYNSKTPFYENKELLFPDFSLTYLGKRHVASQIFKPGFTFYDFRIRTDRENKTVSWTSGTGDIGPIRFTISGKGFYLELKISEKLGKLNSDELVIWKQE